MARKRDKSRLYELIEQATLIFIEQGYKRTKMEDVTRSLGRSTGSIYRYVGSKEALFDLTLRYNIDCHSLEQMTTWPAAKPNVGSTLAFLEESTRLEKRFPTMQNVLAQKNKIDLCNEEFELVLRELYRVLRENAIVIKLIERSALDWPELAELWFEKRRCQIIKELSSYIQLRMEQEILSPVRSAEASARLIINSITFFAIHRHFDIVPMDISEEDSEETVVQAMMGAFLGLNKKRNLKSRSEIRISSI